MLIRNTDYNTGVSCQHLEVSDFSTYSVDLGGKIQVMTLQKCSNCGRFLTLGGAEVPEANILSREAAPKPKMRTITLQLNSDVYETLRAAIEKGNGDPSTIVNDVVAMGLKDYKHLRHT